MSKTMTTLGKVFDKVDTMSKNCKDELIKVEEISFDRLESVRIGSELHRMRTIAQRSMAFRLGIPFQYLTRCPSGLQSQNMNYWMEKELNDELFFRFDGDEVRALFTPKYKPVDNFEVLERLDSLGYGPETQVQCHLDDAFMLLNIPDGNKSFSINGDKMTPGISISNSEVGLASLSIAAFVLRLVCTNGLISKTQVSASYRHVSTRILREFPDVLEKTALEVGKEKNQFKISSETMVSDPLSTIKSFNRQFQLGKEEQDAIEWAWGFEASNNMFHIVNTYTRASQYKDLSAESSYRLQKVAGNILGMVN